MKAIKIISSLLLIAGLVFLVQCGGSSTVASNRPGWCDQGSGFFTGDKGKAFYGVGISSNINNISLRRTTADAQARADLARTFKTRIEDLTKVYIKSVSGGPENAISEEQLAQQTTRAFTDMELTGAAIIDRYYDSVERAQYSLAMLDLNAFKGQIEKMNQLSAEVKQLIEKNAENAFNELDEMVDKKKGR